MISIIKMNNLYKYCSNTYTAITYIVCYISTGIIELVFAILTTISYLLDKTVLMCETISNNRILNIIFEYVAITLGLMAGLVLILISLILGAIFFTIIVLPEKLRDTIGVATSDAISDKRQALRQ